MAEKGGFLMRKIFAAVCCVLLLAGCAAPTGESLPPPEAAGPAGDTGPAEDAAEYAAALAIPLAELEPYAPMVSMEPDVAGVETMGEVLCGETLPGGTRVVCYWHPDRLTDPDCRYEKYWAVHQGDKLLRFAAESSGYEGGYGVRPFSNVLGQSGFCIEAPRGAAYTACDYYVFDGTGVPRLLMDCSNDVLERDVNGDGVTELIWNYRGGQFVTCAFLREGTVCQVEMMSLLAEHLPFPSLPSGDLERWGEEGLPVGILVGGWAVVNEPGPKRCIEGYLRLAEDALELDVPVEQIPLEAWAVLGPAVPAPREWAEQERRNEAETWAGVEPSYLRMEMVSVLEGWMVASVSHGIGAGADNYVYRTHDGGRTWQEAAKLEEAGRYPGAVGFFDDLHAIVGIELHDGAPVFVTRDGGESWERAEFPAPVGADGWTASDVRCSGGAVTLTMAGEEPRREVRLVSRDWGETWEVEE